MSIETPAPQTIEERPADEFTQAIERAQYGDWKEDAVCNKVDSSLFYHPENERGEAAIKRDEAARAICQLCPVRLECMASSVMRRETYGFWGASETERKQALAQARKAHKDTDAPAQIVAYTALSRLSRLAK
jgi:WhiB family transcriptional regulator, redox-sensing transcriptional regulator